MEDVMERLMNDTAWNIPANRMVIGVNQTRSNESNTDAECSSDPSPPAYSVANSGANRINPAIKADTKRCGDWWPLQL